MTESTRAALIHLLTAALRLLTEEGAAPKRVQEEEWRPRFLGDTRPAGETDAEQAEAE